MLCSFDLLLAATSIVIMVVGFLHRQKMWRRGQQDEVSGKGGLARISRLFRYLLNHRRLLENRLRGVAHLFIFWGFLIPLVVVVIAQIGPLMPPWSGPAISLLLELAGILALMGTVILLVRVPENSQSRGHTVYLWILLAIIVTGFLSEGVRLAIMADVSKKMDGLFHPVGGAVSYLVPVSPILLKVLIRIHFFLVLYFVASLPFSAMRHVLASGLNVWYSEEDQRGIIMPITLAGDYFGVGKIDDFTWSRLRDSDACMNCGRCDEVCPAGLSGKPLSPQGLIREIRRRMEEPVRPTQSGEHERNRLIDKDGRVGEEDIWSCTTCMACVNKCPVFVNHLSDIINLRRYALLTESIFPAEYKQLFRNLEVFGDAFGAGSLTREEWASGLGIKKVYEESDVEILLWIGCTGALYDERTKSIATAAAEVLEKAGVRFGILGKRELCCGDPARRMGNEYLFQRLALRNIELMREYGVRKLVTFCPHCFNVFSKEYAQFGADLEVVHVTELIKTLLVEGRLRVKSKAAGLLTYHDPCYLGRYGMIYDAPRDILELILSSKIKEMTRSKGGTFCCGAGGGNFWRGKTTGRRTEELRIEQGLEAGAEGLVTACPFCRIMFDSAAREKGLENSYTVIDVVQLVNQTT